MSLTKVSYSMINGAQVNVLDYGAVGDDSTDNLLFFKNALEHLQSVGGGTLYIPSGVYCISKPIIVRSNIEVYGDGASSVLKNNNPAGYTPAGDCIHIGITNEWKDWEGNSGGITDADIAQWDAGDYSYITTENVFIHDLKLTTDQPAGIEGQGIWVANTQNFAIENIWTDTVATPVSVGNDNPTSLAGSRNGSIKNIYQLVAGKWYDLVYLGECEIIDVSNCFNNPTSNAALNTAIAIGGRARFCNIHNNTIRFQNFNEQIGVDISGYSTPNNVPNVIENNIFNNAAAGVTTYQMNNQCIANNIFYYCEQGIRVYNQGQIIEGNEFVNCTYDLFYKSGSQSYNTDMILSYANIGGDSDGDISAQTFRNCVGVGGFRQFVYQNIDYVVAAPDVSKVTSQGQVLKITGGSTAVLWFRLPANMYQLNQLITYWYANAAGETLKQQLFKRTAAGSYPNLVQIGTDQNYTSSGVGDMTSTWANINETATGIETPLTDQYYIALTITFANADSQLRESLVSYKSFGSNE